MLSRSNTRRQAAGAPKRRAKGVVHTEMSPQSAQNPVEETKGARIAQVSLWVFDVTPRTRWSVLEMVLSDRTRGFGEATLGGREAELAAALARIAGGLAVSGGPELDLQLSAASPLPDAAIVSALQQAHVDAQARRRNQSVADHLGIRKRDAAPVYANVNRRTENRTPKGFAASARKAVEAGHRALKIAPFDEATPEAIAEGGLACIEGGLERMSALRRAVGPEVDLRVDCHWRLTEEAARRVIAYAASENFNWVECPLVEDETNIGAIKALRSYANARGVRLAGLELAVTWEGLRNFVRAGAYDVVMPDVKYIGGVVEMLRVARRLAEAGIAFSPHNPSGPVCSASSLQVCALVDGEERMEIQFDETPCFDTLVQNRNPKIVEGIAYLPEGPGIGIDIAPETFRDLGSCQFRHDYLQIKKVNETRVK